MEATGLLPFSLVLRTSLTAAGLLISLPLSGQETRREAIPFANRTYALFPAASEEQPKLPSPHRTADGSEILTACTERGHYVLVPVNITPGITTHPWEAPLEIDREDFPTLAKTGRHSEAELGRIRSITGRSLEEITELGRPGRLSASGFMAETEDVLSVIKGDNQLVVQLGLTHPELARPLLHVCNLIRVIYKESGQRRTNDFFYGGKHLSLEVEFTRGGQKSIFNDGLDGAWAIKIRRELDPAEGRCSIEPTRTLDPTIATSCARA